MHHSMSIDAFVPTYIIHIPMVPKSLPMRKVLNDYWTKREPIGAMNEDSPILTLREHRAGDQCHHSSGPNETQSWWYPLAQLLNYDLWGAFSSCPALKHLVLNHLLNMMFPCKRGKIFPRTALHLVFLMLYEVRMIEEAETAHHLISPFSIYTHIHCFQKWGSFSWHSAIWSAIHGWETMWLKEKKT